MAGMAVKMVSAFLEAKETKAKEINEDLLKIGWDIKDTSIDIFFKFDDSDTHVHIEGINFIKVPEDKYEIMYKVLNDCNYMYTHVKFALDTEQGQIVAMDDAVIQLDSCGEECFELMLRMLQIVEDAYPKFMKAIWA